jgi:hypothetical protein
LKAIPGPKPESLFMGNYPSLAKFEKEGKCGEGHLRYGIFGNFDLII